MPQGLKVWRVPITDHYRKKHIFNNLSDFCLETNFMVVGTTLTKLIYTLQDIKIFVLVVAVWRQLPLWFGTALENSFCAQASSITFFSQKYAQSMCDWSVLCGCFYRKKELPVSFHSTASLRSCRPRPLENTAFFTRQLKQLCMNTQLKHRPLSVQHRHIIYRTVRQKQRWSFCTKLLLLV